MNHCRHNTFPIPPGLVSHEGTLFGNQNTVYHAPGMVDLIWCLLMRELFLSRTEILNHRCYIKIFDGKIITIEVSFRSEKCTKAMPQILKR